MSRQTPDCKICCYPTAINNNNAQLLVDSTGYTLYNSAAYRSHTRQSADVNRLHRLNLSIMRHATNDFNTQ